jgi:hypothetical protein
MEKEKYISDLKEIKDMMNRSSRFLSLSGLSGISAGIVALIGAYAAHRMVYNGQEFLSYEKAVIDADTLINLLFIAIVTIVFAVGTVIYFTTRETKKRNQKIWDHQNRRFLINLAIPLITGGILCLILLFKGYIGMMAPLTLIFYGLALVNASKYTLNEIRSLGLAEIALGLIASHFIGYGLLFWSIGFGLLHIAYGTVMQLKHGS